ncbi:MAG: 1,4-dihydroxy-6-naphthoate synthase [Bacteroidetes bacterium]|nr:1,4-dihydroxy-6-naphthoate synthase [Bacteroidota bacterium]PHX83239.1 MAG: 1,4-dihydroxy-6-naphthoate synthase [Flavobacteriales bacterium]
MLLTLGFSPCPNDCFMFDAIVNNRIDLEGLTFDVQLLDIETLNKTAINGTVDISKVSYHAFVYCLSNYVLLDAGSALGTNCGPLLIAKKEITKKEFAEGDLNVAIPGQFTTANFLLGLAFPNVEDKTELIFSEIEEAVLQEKFDTGLIIHENRFTYEAKGLKKIIDLGEFWETTTKLPIPLGGIVAKRSLPDEIKNKVNRIINKSIAFAFANRKVSLPYVSAHAQAMSEEVMYRHIDLYVNDFSLELGKEGRRAVLMLIKKAKEIGLIPPSDIKIFLD